MQLCHRNGRKTIANSVLAHIKNVTGKTRVIAEYNFRERSQFLKELFQRTRTSRLRASTNFSAMSSALKLAWMHSGMFWMVWKKETMSCMNLLFLFFMFGKIFSRNQAKNRVSWKIENLKSHEWKCFTRNSLEIVISLLRNKPKCISTKSRRFRSIFVIFSFLAQE